MSEGELIVPGSWVSTEDKSSRWWYPEEKIKDQDALQVFRREAEST